MYVITNNLLAIHVKNYNFKVIIKFKQLKKKLQSKIKTCEKKDHWLSKTSEILEFVLTTFQYLSSLEYFSLNIILI